MPKLSEAKPEGLMVQMIGKPGTGKSIGAASFPKPMYIFDLESRLAPVKNFFGSEDIEFDTYFVGDLEKFVKKLESFQLNCPYKSVVIDGLTPLADMFLDYGIHLRGKDKSKENKFSKGVVELNDVSDYNVETRGILHVINILRELPRINRILITHILESEAFNLLTNKSVLTQKTMTGGNKVSAKIPAYFNEVWNFYTKEPIIPGGQVNYCMSAADRGFGLGKTCIPDLPAENFFTRGFDANGKKEGNINVKGSLYSVLEPFLKKASLV